jgi:hypothetical protein
VSAVEKPKVTLTISLGALRDLFMAGNRSSGCSTMEDADPLALALDIVDHAAMELYTLQLAITGDTDNANEEELSLHAWRISRQLTAGTELVRALVVAKRQMESEAAQ